MRRESITGVDIIKIGTIFYVPATWNVFVTALVSFLSEYFKDYSCITLLRPRLKSIYDITRYNFDVFIYIYISNMQVILETRSVPKSQGFGGNIYIYTKEKEKKKQFEPSLEKILEHVLNF